MTTQQCSMSAYFYPVDWPGYWWKRACITNMGNATFARTKTSKVPQQVVLLFVSILCYDQYYALNFNRFSDQEGKSLYGTWR